MYNVHVLGGVKQQNLDVAIAIWGEPISVVMKNEAYKKKFGLDNPNIPVLAEMKKAGIKILGCGQSIMRFGIDSADVNPDVTVALSRFTAVSTYQLKGYACFKY
jgi:intracellular sulfur oxidation DsrE/DsrF family protein